MSKEDLAMLNHFQPKALRLLAEGKVDLNYIPGNTTNKSLGYYLYGDAWSGVKIGKGQG